MTSDTTKAPVSIRAAVLTISDSRTRENDSTGDFLAQALEQAGHECVQRQIAPSTLWQIRKILCAWIADEGIQVIITNGGTGFTHGKATVPAIAPLLEQTITGFGELFRHLSYLDIGSSALQSDALAGVANDTLVFCLPGSTGACRLAWDGILKEQLDSRQAPCNFASHYA